MEIKFFKHDNVIIVGYNMLLGMVFVFTNIMFYINYR